MLALRFFLNSSFLFNFFVILFKTHKKTRMFVSIKHIYLSICLCACVRVKVKLLNNRKKKIFLYLIKSISSFTSSFNENAIWRHFLSCLPLSFSFVCSTSASHVEIHFLPYFQLFFSLLIFFIVYLCVCMFMFY